MKPLNILFIDDEKDLGEIVTILAKKTKDKHRCFHRSNKRS